MGAPEEDERYKVFGDFHAYLNRTFPLVHASAELRKVNTWGLLYKFEGSIQNLKPGLLAAHQDVVPVAEETLNQWTHPPFEGFIDEKQGLVWGRGSSDDKNMLVSIFEALEKLSEEGWKPRRTLYIASGFDEEVNDSLVLFPSLSL
jgi:Gly-Xaa carboxypeptidase